MKCAGSIGRCVGLHIQFFRPYVGEAKSSVLMEELLKYTATKAGGKKRTCGRRPDYTFLA